MKHSAFAAPDEQLKRFAAARAGRAALPFRPVFHFVSPEARSNDPNGLCFWRGRWHFFYQAYVPVAESGAVTPCWGHAVSDDLVHWRDLPYAIEPGPEYGSWSGATLVEEDRVIAMYYGHPVGNMTAVSSDPELRHWTKIGGGAVIPNPLPIWQVAAGEERLTGAGGVPVRGPAGAVNVVYDVCIWKKGEYYYSLSGGARQTGPAKQRMRAEFLYRSRDLEHWEYLHDFLEGDRFARPGDDGACPYFWPIGDRYILLHFSHHTTSHYLIGDYDTERDKFIVRSGGDFGFNKTWPGGVLAPTAAPDGAGGVIAMFNMQFGANNLDGDNQLYTLPRRLTLGADGELRQTPVEALKTLRADCRSLENLTLPDRREFVAEEFRGNTAELELEADPGSAQIFELNVFRSPESGEAVSIRFHRDRGVCKWERNTDGNPFSAPPESIVSVESSHAPLIPEAYIRAPECAPVFLAPGERLKLHVFLDRSMLEVFVNDRQCLAQRVYPREGCDGVSFRAVGGEATVLRCDFRHMNGIYD